MDAILEIMLSRRSVMPKRLGLPAPSQDELQQMMDVAVMAPDHGSLSPSHFILIPEHQREDLANLFIMAKEKRCGILAESEQKREHEKAHNAPVLLAVHARLNHWHDRASISEQLVSVGAAIQNILLTAHAKGYGAIVLSGERSSDPVVRSGLGIPSDHMLVGFISIGTIKKQPKAKSQPSSDHILSIWEGFKD